MTARISFPRAAWLIIGVEFWERFSFYGMLTILVLFLTAEPTLGGLGWPDKAALSLLGWYTGAMYALPMIGGYVADHLLGRRRAITIGATLILFGQLLMAAPMVIPQLIGQYHGAPLLQTLRDLHVPLAYWVRTSAVDAAIWKGGALLGPQGAEWLTQAYGSAAFCLYGALLCLILGNAIMKSTMVVLCGDIFAIGDTRREAAYAYYYLGITLGAMLAGIVVGTLSQAYGWQCGFLVGAAGITLALMAYLYFGPSWLGSIGNASLIAEAEIEKFPAGPTCRTNVLKKFALLAILAVFLCTYSIGSFQLFGSWSLFIDRSVNRTLVNFSIPVPWFTSINALVIIALAPPLAGLWIRLATRHQHIDLVHKYVFALAVVACAQFLMYAAASTAGVDKAAIWFPLLAVAIAGVGELVAWPSTYDIVYRAAPQGFVSATMGAWYLMTLGLGGFLSGIAGEWAAALGFEKLFLLLGVAFSIVALVAFLARGLLLRFAAGLDVHL